MGFDKGMAGAVVVVLALISSVMLCVVTNIESKDVTKELPEYVADITGGFSADREKSYSDYNPSKNYNGYTNNTVTNQYPINFKSVGYTNNYPISHRLDQATSPTLIGPSSFATSATEYDTLSRYPGWNSISENYSYYDPSEPNMPLYIESSYVGSPGTWKSVYGVPTTYTVSLSSILNECVTDGTAVLGTTPVTVQISIPATILSKEIEYPYNYDIRTTVTYYLSNNIMIIPSNASPSQLPSSWYSYDTIYSMGEDSEFNTEILYTPSENTCTISVNDVPIYSGVNPTNYKMVYGTPLALISLSRDATGWGEEQGYTDSVWRTTESLGVDTPHFAVSYLAETITDYIDTRYGISVRNSEEVVWNNGQQNGVTSIVFSVWDQSSMTFTDNGDYEDTGVIRYYGSSATDTFTVSRISGRTYVTLNGGTPIDIGTWPQIQLNIDNINGEMTAIPITAWNNFNNYALSETSVLIGQITKGSLNTITWTANDSFKFQVTNTTVFFNTYGVVMINPHITITDFWPNYPKFMVSLSKVATIGTSITLGSSTFPITDGTITVNGNTLAIPDLQIFYENIGENQWQITLSTDKESTQITEANTSISLAGTWYFNAGFYEVVRKTVTEREWSPAYAFNLNLIVIFMAGFILLGGFLIYKMGYADTMSIVVLVVSEIILIVIGGTS